MSARLIGITVPVVDGMTEPQQMLAYCARVSSTANQTNHATGPKLIRSLLTRKEWSPLEMVNLVIEIETTRDIARQILRHRSFSFQEFSQRYAVVDDEPTFREARLQDHGDRQNSIETDDEELQQGWLEMQARVNIATDDAYSWALENGIAKEVARAVLPEGMTASRLYMAGMLRSWLHYCELRCDKKTQKEHRAIAWQVRDILAEQFPDIADLLPNRATVMEAANV
ncbi:FAD-dependent thymidylate synthase [Acetobacter sp. DsW_063]|uniref:FAD-dependent thymidylate synthase n=1 Tax=Acetobacter sp. DsW_063 TaxID=1514894 RepID=UPI000B66C5A9|nr:FAD-dependent thymidylate synthase [Acetobacter sp. DsW_063]OUJ16385.1 FAD-dependent thymidylate synthase [Acetobacter sp. DsW_063]